MIRHQPWIAVLLLVACGDTTSPTPTSAIPSWAKVAPEQIAEAEKYRVPVAFENDLGMQFGMGSPEGEWQGPWVMRRVQ